MKEKHRDDHNPEDHDPIGVDDQSLGEALGVAIRRRVEAPAERPPAEVIVGLAAARAKARRIRRVILSAAACVALLAGGVAVWNALDSDQSTELVVVNQPSDSLGRSIAPGRGVGSPDGSQESSPTPGGVAVAPATPEDLSTGPVLEWTEFDPAQVFGPDIQEPIDLVSIGDGRVLVRSLEGANKQVMVSENGTDWAKIPLPSDFQLSRLDFTVNRWLVTGWALDSFDPHNDLRAFFSDDQGKTWTELKLQLAGSSETSSVALTLVSGSNMVIAVEEQSPSDAGASRVGIHFSNGGPAELVAEYSAQEVFGSSTADGFYLTLHVGDSELLVTSPDGRRWARASLDESNWTTEFVDVVHHFRNWQNESDDSADSDSFDRYFGYYESREKLIWLLDQQPGEGFLLERFNGVYAPVLLTDLPLGVFGADHLAAAPAGAAVVARKALKSITDQINEFRATKDGYELRFDLVDGNLTLRDLASDTIVVEFGALVLELEAVDESSWTFPEGVRAIHDELGELDGLVFEDPVTGEELVRFIDDELIPWTAGEDPTEAAGNAEESLERWLGWSADGNTWGWQTLPKAFGLPDLSDIEEELTKVKLAVGEDFVIARVQTYETAEDPAMLLGQTPRWFIARTAASER